MKSQSKMPARFTYIRMGERQFPSARMVRLTCLWTPFFHLPVNPQTREDYRQDQREQAALDRAQYVTKSSR